MTKNMKISNFKFLISNFKSQGGQILVLSLVVLSLVMVSTILIISGSVTFNQNSHYSIEEVQAISLAEAGIDKAVASLNKTGGAYSGNEEIGMGNGSFSVTVTSQDSGSKVIKSTGYIPNKSNPKVKRTVEIITAIGIGASFAYGVQVGEGGLELGSNNTVLGSIYSNGNITANNNNEITGDAYVAGGPQPTADQEALCQPPNCGDFPFGKKTGSDNVLDVAQSFKPSISAPLNKVSLRLKKVGNPSDVTVRILKDNAGKPDKNNVLTSGTLYSSLVISNYGWVDVAFNTSPNINANESYWIMIDTSDNANNNWSWEKDNLQSYNGGAASWSPNWQASNPTWNTVNADLGFKIFMSGSPTSIRATNKLDVGGNVHANTIENLTIAKDAFYQVLLNTSVGGLKYPNSADPPPKVFPISESNIQEWKNIAESNGVVTGDINTCITILESKKYVGNINLGSNCTVTVKSPVWVTGNFTLINNNRLKLDSSYGVASGLIIIEGTTEMDNNNKLDGSGTDGSILMLLSTYDSRTNNIAAVKVKNSGNTGVLYANNGILEPGNNNNFRELTAWGIRIINNSTITYDVGLSSVLFSSGPSGSYSIVRGTYQLK